MHLLHPIAPCAPCTPCTPCRPAGASGPSSGGNFTADVFRSLELNVGLGALMEAVARLVEGLVQEWTRSELPRLQARARRHWREARAGEWCGTEGEGGTQEWMRSALPRL